MEEIVKVALLGCDLDSLEKICERVNEDHPTEIHAFKSLNDFLKFCMSEKPAVVGINVAFQHKSTPKFPKIFKMAMGVPVFAFVEKADYKTDRLMSSTTAGYKIQGTISAQNLWMRITNIMKDENPDEDDISFDPNKDSQKNNSIHLKGEKSKKMESGAGLDSILKALNQGEPESSEQDNQGISTSDGRVKESGKDIDVKSEEDDQGIKIDSRDVRSIKNLDEKDIDDSNRGIDPKKKKPLEKAKNEDNSKKKNEKAKISLDLGEENSNSTDLSKKENKNRSGKVDLTLDEDSAGIENNDEAHSLSDLLAELDDVSSGSPKNSLEKSSPSKNSKREKDKKNQESGEKDEEKENNFGAVKLSDKKALEKEKNRKEKEQNQKDNIKKQNILKSSCELGLQTAYLSYGTENYQAFSVKYLSTFIVESGSFTGILVLATTAELGTEELVDDFRATVIENLKINKISCEISKEYPISMDVEKYQDVVKKFADFSINHSDDMGNQQNVFFVSRESVRPAFSESSIPDMLEVDIKVIPPQTPVTFDAYIHLPINKKFVRYLKEGRSLSLEQAKRHMGEDQNILYLPKTQEDKFVAFFVKNTLNWDFTLHKIQVKKQAS